MFPIGRTRKSSIIHMNLSAYLDNSLNTCMIYQQQSRKIPRSVFVKLEKSNINKELFENDRFDKSILEEIIEDKDKALVNHFDYLWEHIKEEMQNHKLRNKIISGKVYGEVRPLIHPYFTLATSMVRLNTYKKEQVHDFSVRLIDILAISYNIRTFKNHFTDFIFLRKDIRKIESFFLSD